MHQRVAAPRHARDAAGRPPRTARQRSPRRRDAFGGVRAGATSAGWWGSVTSRAAAAGPVSSGGHAASATG
ncbi:hypothetical protein C1701_08575 [Actinoalloteichus sp. AHMU CJ021]|nr:hypothetical protein C1701_08575 [Actinoalloteichus sp. AHMU CJ021]